MDKKLVLVGNPNSGKTTIFNKLTGGLEKTGNRSGVTIKVKERRIKSSQYILYDLPGIYSLNPCSIDEKISCEFIENKNYEYILNVVNGCNLERNLYLTLDLILKGFPVILIINMADRMEKEKVYIDVKKLSEILGIPIIITSVKNNRLKEDIFKSIKNYKFDSIWIQRRYRKNYYNENIEDKSIKRANVLYKLTEEICFNVIKGKINNRITKYIDKIVLNKYMGFPVFFIVMGSIFYLTFGQPGKFIQNYLINILEFTIVSPLKSIINMININEVLKGLIEEGIIGSFFTVISYVPGILILLFLISLLEDTGYMSRASVMTDKILRKMGISGRGFIPLIMGFGCTTPAILSARTINNDFERKLTLLLIPYMSCSAKLPFYMFFTEIFFKDKQFEVIFLMYIIGIAVAFIIGYTMNFFFTRKYEEKFIIELPPYKMPSVTTAFRVVYDKLIMFIRKTGSIIFILSISMWLLKHFDIHFNFVSNEEKSIISYIGKIFLPLFRPLGFKNWKTIIPLFSGLMAKESIVSSFVIICNNMGKSLYENMHILFNNKSAMSYMIFCLLYMPCLASFVTYNKEVKSFKWTVLSIFLHFFFAYTMSFIVYRIACII